MISISRTALGLLVEPSDAEGTEALKFPVHRLMLRGTLGGTPKATGLAYEIPTGIDALEVLNALTTHFGRYGIAFNLDQGCLRILKEADTLREEYRKSLEAGLSAKSRLPLSERRSMKSWLGRTFTRPLTELQCHALYHIQRVQNGANFSVPGSGKTSVALAHYQLLREAGIVNSLLVIGPASSFEPWETEYEKCFGRHPRSLRLAGRPKAERQDIYRFPEKCDLFLITYHTAARDVESLQWLLRKRKSLLVLDESHYVKRPEGGVIADAVLRIAGYAVRRMILTGTPMPNGLPDLWSQVTFLWPNILPLGKSSAYLRKLRDAGEHAAIGEVKRTIGPLFFRTTKSQLKLPKATFKRVSCPPSPLQHRIYKGIAEKYLMQVKEAPSDRAALREWRRARAIRLLQVASNPALLLKRYDEFQLPPVDVGGMGLRSVIEHYPVHETPSKVSRAIEIARELAGKGHKVLLWSMFVHNITMLEKHLSELNPVVIHGGVPYRTTDETELDREALIGRFKTDSKCMAMIANPSACAESISLHDVCHDAIYLDRSFNCAHYIQSLDRIHRLGLKASEVTTYYLLMTNDSIDQIVEDRLKEKMDAMMFVIEGDLPGRIPGYWDVDASAEEDIDLEHVEAHIKDVAGK